MNKFVRRLGGLVAFGLALPWALPAWSANTADVLVLYTQDARNSRNGQDIDARIASYISYSNQAYQNSQVDLQLRLVGKGLLNRDYRYVTEANLNSLRTDTEVLALRRQTGADLVVLLNLAQQVSGGYVCGIGYIPSGDSARGVFHQNAGSVAFSLVGVDCSLATFTHEIGHNMGLGHSQRQNSNGGVWHWGRGYGVDGMFSDIMAYPQSFGTRNQLQRLSNPRQTDCAGLACGVDRGRSDGADAAGNIAALVTQITAFMPTVTSVDTGAGPTAASQPCATPAVANNLIVNGSFASTQNWFDVFNSASLKREEVDSGCIKDVLTVADRTAYYSGAFQNISGKLQANTRYRLNAEFSVRGVDRATVRVALQHQSSTGTTYTYLSNASATTTEFSPYQQEFTLTNANVSGLMIYGPSAGVELLLDNVSLVPVTAQSGSTLTEAPAGSLRENFDGQAHGWGAFQGSRTAFAPHGDGYSLVTTQRGNRHAGPMLDVAGIFEADASYQLSVQARHHSADSELVQVWVYFEDDHGPHWVKVSEQIVPADQWQTLTGEFALDPAGAITHARLHVWGPAAGTDLEIDDLLVQPAD